MNKTKIRNGRIVSMVLAMVFAAINGAYAYSQGRSLFCAIALFCIEWLPFWWIIHRCFIALIDRSQQELACPKPTWKRFGLHALGLLVMWLPYMVLCFPGNINGDTGDAILHGLGILPNNNNPFFLNWVYALVYRFGAHFGNAHIGVAAFCIAQTIGYIAALSYAILLAEEAGAPKWVSVFLLLLYGLIPVFPASAFCIAKDSIFGLLLLCFSILLYMQKRYEWFYHHPFWLTVLLAVSALLPLMRNGAVYLTALSLLAALLVCRQRRGKAFLLAAALLSLLTGVVWPSVAQIAKPMTGEFLSLPLQQTAYYMNHYEATEEEKQTLSEVIPLDSFAKYQEGQADNVKYCFRADADMKDVFRYFNVWWKQLLKHPDAYLKALYLHTNGYYTPSILRNDLKPHVYLGYGVRNNVFGATKLEPNENPGLAVVDEIDQAVCEAPVFGLLQRIGIYVWLLAAAIVYAFYARRPSGIVCYLPMVFVFCACLLSPVNCHIRYAFPLMVTAPVLCAANLFQKQTPSNQKCH